MKKILLGVFSIITIAALQSCQEQQLKSTPDRKFLDVSGMDSSVKPGDNFFLYVNGGWLKNTPIPATESRVGSFPTLLNQTKDHLHSILEDLAKGNQTPGSIEQKLGDFYASGMDTATIDKRGYDPVKPYLQKIDAIKNPKDIMQYAASQQLELSSILFSVGIVPDDKNSAINIAAFTQGGLGLPDRDYYFKNDPPTLAVVKAYQIYVQKMFEFIGYDSVAATKKMMAVYNLEKKIAESHTDKVALRDPQSNYHKVTVAEMDKEMPAFGWKSTLGAMGITIDSINVQQPKFFKKLNELLVSVPIDTWKDYLRFHTIDSYGGGLTTDFVNTRFDYYGKALNGQQKMKPRWDRMATATDNNLGEALGQVYTKRYFTEDAKKRMLELVNNLQTAFEARISKLDWMSDETKTKAKEKLHAFLKQIGYPDKWRDYSKVTIERDKYFENLVSASKNEYQFQIGKQGKPVDKTEWDMTPPTINAGYYPTFNRIVFPAGILQFPFFDLNADDAINYGAIGLVIGHEMTHGFDDQGAQYDKDGNLKNWWGKDDSVKFAAKTKLVVDQYNGFVVIDTLHVNGALTAGENIADLGGLNIAYDAFKMTKQGQGNEKIDGFTPDQRFFMAYAQISKGKKKDELTRRFINIDPHSPEMWRINGPLSNFTPFYTAFNVQPGEKMYKEEKDRIKIW
ncbi:MAG: M13 family metallopeptidase [Bacteroidetes bacterium]|nr:M13 family metallopeptidase [Bacteroidota bacterium]